MLLLEELVVRERWDFFELIDFFHRAPKLFFEEILKKDIDYDLLEEKMHCYQSIHNYIKTEIMHY